MSTAIVRNRLDSFMKPTRNELFYPLQQVFDRFFDEAERLLNVDARALTSSFPPHNIIKLDDSRYLVELAVAGFGQGDIDVSTRDGDVIITGEKSQNALPEGHTYRHQGISSRKFMRSWTMGEYVEVVDAICKDGILTVRLERRVPEAIKPKSIEISYSN